MAQEGESRLTRRNVSRDVAEHIRKLILDGEIRPNEKIPQDEIAGDLGVSRIPVREALFTLASEGFVVLRPYRGAFVSPLEREDVEDQFEMYGLVHGLAAERAAQKIDEATLARLEELNTRFRDTKKLDRLDAIDWEFHRVINLAGGSRRLQTVLRTLTTLSRNVPRNFFPAVPGAQESAVEAHTRILRALRNRDGVRAFEACNKHLREEGRQVIEMMEKGGFWSRSRDGELVEPPDSASGSGHTSTTSASR